MARLRLNFTGRDLLAAGHVRLDFGALDSPPITLPSLRARNAMPWADATVLAKSSYAPWTQTPIKAGLGVFPVDESEELFNTSILPWAGTPAVDKRMAFPWGELSALARRSLAPWHQVPPLDTQRVMPWGQLDALGVSSTLPWRHPPARDRRWNLPWSAPDYLFELRTTLPWRHPPRRDTARGDIFPWGEACMFHVWLEQEEPEPPRPPQEGTPLYLNFVCRHDEGRRYTRGHVKLVFGRPCNDDQAVIVNSVYVVKLPERTPVPTSAVGLSIDPDSFAWSVDLTVLTEEGLDLIKPVGTSLIEVEIGINGWQWIAVVESWSRQRSYGRTQWGVKARSASAQLARPYAQPYDYQQPAAPRTAQQVALEQIQFLPDWSIEWLMDDWTLPASTYTASRGTPLSIIADIAQAGGGIVQTHRYEKKLIVAPRYKEPPWEWAAYTADLIVPDTYTVTESIEYDSRPPYNRVFVAGERQNTITGQVTRLGTAGDIQASPYTHPLISDSVVARAKGTEILSQAGKKSIIVRQLPLMAAGSGMDLLEVGQIVRLPGDVKALVTSVQIQAARQPSGSTSALVIRQRVEFEAETETDWTPQIFSGNP